MYMLPVQPRPHWDTTERGRGVFRHEVFIKAIETTMAENTGLLPNNLTSPLFARVLFARTIQAYRGHFYNQTAAADHLTPSGRRDFVQPRRQH